MFHLDDPDYKSAGQLAKILIVFLTEALFTSVACLNEIHAAVQNNIRIIPIRIQDVNMKDVAWWKEHVKNDDELRIKRNMVVGVLKGLNSIPVPGNTFCDDFEGNGGMLVAAVTEVIGQPVESLPPLTIEAVCPSLC